MDSITPQSAPRYRFADLTLDVGRCRVARGDETIPLSRLSFELLRALVVSAPNVVRYDDLSARVWGPRRIVTPENLAKRVMMLRQALGDHAEQPRYVEGLRGQGYRLIPEVETHSPQPRDGTQSGAELAPASSSNPGVIRPERPQARGGRRFSYGLTTGIALAFVLAALLAFQVGRAPETDRAVVRLLLDVRPAERLVGSAASPRPSRTAMALSPDGSTVVFTGVSGGILQLYKRRLEENEAMPMPGTEGAVGPFFSADGAWVGFWANHKLKRVSLDGGTVDDIVDAARGFYGAAWGPNDTIVFSDGRGKGIARVPAGGGVIQTVINGDPEEMQMLPRMLPGNRAMLYTQLSDRDETSIVLYRFDTGEQRTLVDDGADARFSPTGHLLFMRRGVLMAAPFDAERLTLMSTPVAVVDDVMQAVGAYNDGDETRAGQFDVAENGTLIYLKGGVYPSDRVDAYWVDRSGSATRIPIEGPIDVPRVSPDGTRIAYTARRGATRFPDIWVYDIERQTRVRLTQDGINHYPVWSPDSKNLVFGLTAAGLSHLALVAADGSRPPVPLMTSTSESFPFPSSWSAGNETIVFVSQLLDDSEIWTLDMAADGEPKPLREPQLFLDGPLRDTHPALSPDGRWLAYASNETGAVEVYVQRYPEGGQRIPISTGGGYAPIWAPDGGQLFYWRGTAPKQVIAVDFDATGDYPVINAPRALFEPSEYSNAMPVRAWDLSPDGQKFLLIKDTPQPPVTQMHVVVNWTAELKRRVPVD